MNCLTKLFTVLLLALTLSGNGLGQFDVESESLVCSKGPNYDSEIQYESLLFPIRCRSDQRFCLRVEATLLSIKQANATAQTVAAGECASAIECDRLSCETVLQRYWSINFTASANDDDYSSTVDYSGNESGNWDPSYNVMSCSIECCTEERCNQNTIEYILSVSETKEKLSSGSAPISASFVVIIFTLISSSFVMIKI